MTAFGPDLPRYTELAPGVRRLLAPNPSMMTGPGTNTYLFGVSGIAVIDPGPEIDTHIDGIVEAAGAPVRWVLVTHTHPDHSPGAMALAARTGAEVLGRPPPEHGPQDRSFSPTRLLCDGDALETGEFTLEVVHTPGHASNHLCYRHSATNWLVTGDHVIDGSTVVINPPDGDMSDYIASLKRLRAMNCDALLPGHGDRIEDPARAIDRIVEHRLLRERRVLAAVRQHPWLEPHELVPYVYHDVSPHLFPLAERSLYAHLLKLEQDGALCRHRDAWSEDDRNG